ncbi:Nei endonuclease VIII-like 1 [Halocaridina rubra]|uniref:DNA-(apurinic or apyrimidinic site) lyase n=1 Tax=Halocaridina rubra TaxID=373956 RepID=A0AAN9AAI6_HALRR
MPEGPELYLASIFITTVSNNRLYGGQVEKSEVSTKNPEVNWDCKAYRVSAAARGKELKITLHEGETDKKGNKNLDILFRFGMSGSFKFTTVSEIPKHAHLRFYTVDEEPPMVLSFVDYRRFGRWRVDGNWDADRGPDPMWEYQCFRENVLANLKTAAFNKPICEALLNQKYFNGIGNYLRAEILYRCGIRPFDQAREVLMELKLLSQWYENKSNLKSHVTCKTKNDFLKVENIDSLERDLGSYEFQPDILDLCHIVPKEVINLSGGGKGYNVDPDADEDEYAAFRNWLRCYYQDEMKNMVDHNKRTIWFAGEPGKLVPKEHVERSKIKRKKKTEHTDDTSANLEAERKQKVPAKKVKTGELKHKKTSIAIEKKTPNSKRKNAVRNSSVNEIDITIKLEKPNTISEFNKKVTKKTSKERKKKNGKTDVIVTSEYFSHSPKGPQKKNGPRSKAMTEKLDKGYEISVVPVRRSSRKLSS